MEVKLITKNGLWCHTTVTKCKRKSWYYHEFKSFYWETNDTVKMFWTIKEEKNKIKRDRKRNTKKKQHQQRKTKLMRYRIKWLNGKYPL